MYLGNRNFRLLSKRGNLLLTAGSLFEFYTQTVKANHAKTKERKAKTFRSFVVEVTGLEPTTSWSRTKRATKLRYTSLFTASICFGRSTTSWSLVAAVGFALAFPVGQRSRLRSAAPLPENLAPLRFSGAPDQCALPNCATPRCLLLRFASVVPRPLDPSSPPSVLLSRSP